MEWLTYLRVNEDTKDKKWYEKIFDSLAPNTVLDSSRQKRLLGIYGVLNNDLSIIKEELDRLCRPAGTLFDPFDADEKLLSYNRIFPKFQYHIGQMLNYGSNFTIMRLSDEGNKLWDEEFRDTMRRSINERIEIRLEQSEMKASGADDSELEAYYKNNRTYEEPEALDKLTFMSSAEIFFNKVLHYFITRYNLPQIKKQSFKHVLASDMTLTGIVHGTGDRPVPKVFNPLYLFHAKSADEERIEKGPYWGIHIPISLAQAYDELSGIVSDRELADFLQEYGVTPERAMRGDFSFDSQLRPDFSRQQQLYDSQSAIHSTDVGQHMDDQTDSSRGRTTVWKTYLEFKAWRKVLILTSINEYNKKETTIVPGNYEIPKGAGKVSIRNRYTGMRSTRYEWIDLFGNPVTAEYFDLPRRYEAVRYGSKLIVQYREQPNQPLSIDDPMDFELSAKGRYFTSTNASPLSIVERALNVYVQILFIKKLQNRELAKYEGVIKSIDARYIPKYINKNEDGTPIFDGVSDLAVWRYFRRKLGDSYFDSSQSATTLQPNSPNTKPITTEVVDSIAHILNMQNLLDMLDREMSLQMLVPPQAEGSFQPYSNASDNQLAVKAGSIIAESYYAEHNEVMRLVINEYITQFRNYYLRFFENNPGTEETFLNYILADGSKEVIRITPELLQHYDMGIFLKESYYSRQYRDLITERLQDIAQNQGEGVEIMSELIMSVARGDSPEEVHYNIQKATQKQKSRIEEMQNIQSQIAEQIRMRELKEEEAKADRDSARRINEMNLEYDRKNELAAINIFLGNPDDQGSNDQDDIPGYLEALKLIRSINREDRKQLLEEQKFNHQKKMDEESQKKEVNGSK